MKEIEVKITLLEDMLGTSAANPDIHRDFIASKAPDEDRMMEEVEAIEDAEDKFEKAMTVFSRDENGNPIVWDYQWKGYFKDAYGALKKIPGTEASKIKAYKKDIDGLVFVEPRKIPIKLSGEMGVCQRPLRASTPMGERVALASSESIPAGSEMIFTVRLLRDSDEKGIIEALKYGRMRGFGQWRNSGKGRFKVEILSIKEGSVLDIIA